MITDDLKRLQALRETELLDTPAEERFDRLTRLASQIFNTPIALVSLVDSGRQWFKSRQGLAISETDRQHSFCSHAIQGSQTFEVHDARVDPRFKDKPLVTGAPHIRFYAGAPLTTLDGYRIGTLCIISDRPRQLTDTEHRVLRDLADCVEAEINFVDQLRQSKALAAARQLGEIITRAQSQFIKETDRHRAFDNLLKDLMAVSESEYGFIGEVLTNAEGQPYLRTFAITDIAWDAETRAYYRDYVNQGLEFRNLNTLFGAALTSGKPVISNDVFSDPRSGGIPKGHPALNAFLGVPIYHNGQMLGMFGLANRPQGYDSDLVTFLQPIIVTIGQLVHASHLRTQHQQAQKEIALLSRVAAETTNGVIITDAQGNVEWINEGFTRLTGYTLNDIIGRKPGDILQGPATDADTINTMRMSMAQNKGFNVDVANYKKAGQLYWVRISCTPLLDPRGSKQGFIAIQSDITEHKQIETALADQAGYTQAIIDNMVDGLITIDARGIIQSFNPSAETIFGYSAHEVQGKNISMLMPSPYREMHDGFLRNYQETGIARIIGIGRELEGQKKMAACFQWNLLYLR